MRKLLTIFLALALVLPVCGQHKTTSGQKRTTTTRTTNKRTTTRKPVAKRTTTKKKTTAAKSNAKKSTGKTYSNASIRGLQNQRADIQKKIKEQEKALRANQADVKNRLKNLLVINSEIEDRQKKITNIEQDITHINGNIDMLTSQLNTLKEQLHERQAKYIKSMRYLAKHNSVQDKLMFIFSAHNFAQMYRRLRFVREYGAYQKAQGEQVRAKQQEVNTKFNQLQDAKAHKNNLLYKGKQEKTHLQNKQSEQQTMVDGLQKQQKTIVSIIADQRKKDAALNAQIDRLVAIEVEKARQRAEAEAKRKAAAAEAARRRAAELARKKAAAEAAARENARRIAEAKAREARLKEEARQAALAEAEARRAKEEAERKASAKKAANARALAERREREAAERKERAEQAAREAAAQRQAAELKAKTEAERNRKEIAEAKEDAEEVVRFSSADRLMNNGFEANRGRLPMPITGNYRIVTHYGNYNVEGLRGVTLDNKGINIMGSAGSHVRSVYDGEVSGVFGYSGSMVVMVRHGAYISVYCNLKSVAVSKGQHVSTRQVLGSVGGENVLQFRLYKEKARLNPEQWLGR